MDDYFDILMAANEEVAAADSTLTVEERLMVCEDLMRGPYHPIGA